MKASQLLISALLLLLYGIIYYIYAWILSQEIEAALLPRYISYQESALFKPFIPRSSHNLFDFVPFDDWQLSNSNSGGNLTLTIIQPKDYHDVHVAGSMEDDLILSQNDSLIFEISGSTLSAPAPSSLSSAAIYCLHVSAELCHSTDFRSNVREFYYQLPASSEQVSTKLREVPHLTNSYPRIHCLVCLWYCFE